MFDDVPLAARPRRVALYSHDTQGLGHVRRNLALADALAAGEPTSQTLLITGAPAAAALPLVDDETATLVVHRPERRAVVRRRPTGTT